MAVRGECGKTCHTTIGIFASLALLVSGCDVKTEGDYPDQSRTHPGGIVYDSELEAKPDLSIFGDGGLDPFDLGGKRKNSQDGPGIAVNSFLWRASLDTIAFLPLSSADPFGGVIITDWYSPPETPGPHTMKPRRSSGRVRPPPPSPPPWRHSVWKATAP